MSAFTAVADWTKGGQDLAGANEIVLAYSERKQALGGGATGALSAGDDAQSKTLWLAMQTWLEANCTSYVDSTNGPLAADIKSVLMYTLATWRAAAGLDADDGFSRYKDGALLGYGNMQAGDDRVKENFQELQAGFSVLSMTAPSLTSWTADGELNCATGESYPYWAGGSYIWTEAKAGAESSNIYYNQSWDERFSLSCTPSGVYPTCNPFSGGGPSAGSTGSKRHSDFGWEYEASLNRSYAYPHLVQGATFISRTIYVYLYGTIGLTYKTYNAQGDGVTEVLDLIDTESDTDAAVDEMLAKVGSTPVAGTYPTWCDEPDYFGWTGLGYVAHLATIVKWSFTNA